MNAGIWFAFFTAVALKTTALLGLAWTASMLLRRHSASVRHAIWTAAAAAVLALPLFSAWLPALPLRSFPAIAPGVAAFFNATGIAGQGSPAAAAAVSPGAVSTQSVSWHLDWRLIVISVWLAGLAVMLARLLFSFLRVARIRRSARTSPESRPARRLARHLGIRRTVAVLETERGSMPMACGGLFRPAICLPEDAREWSEERRRVVLLHEMAHLKRGDVMAHVIGRLALSVHWWNPLAWLAWRELLREGERAADDLVLAAGTRASDYASHLLEIAQSLRSPVAFGSAAVGMARQSELEGRLAAILDSSVRRAQLGRASILAAVLAAVVLIAPLAAVRAQDQASGARTFATSSTGLDATIRAAAAQKNFEMLEKIAAALEDMRQYDNAEKLLEAAVALREQLFGSQSVGYGVGVMKLAGLESKRNQPDQAVALYSKAAQVLGDRTEAVPALMVLGQNMLAKKNYQQAIDYFEKAQNLDGAQAGPAQMWMAIVREREQNAAAAETLYRSALSVESGNSAESANTLDLYARFLKNQGREDESKLMSDRATEVRRALAKPHQASANLYKIGNGVSAPKLLYKVEPAYTEEARVAQYQGTVVLSVEVGADGIARNFEVVRGLGLGLDENAISAVQQWHFQPGVRDGAPVTILATIEVNFRLL